MCGLKLSTLRTWVTGQQVTPCMGVWIETTFNHRIKHKNTVTPCMGVWIETLYNYLKTDGQVVTPCMGVWIETSRIKPSR